MDRILATYFPMIIIFGSAVVIVAIVFAYKIVMVILQARLEQNRPLAHRELGNAREAREPREHSENIDALAQKARDLNERVKNLEEIFGHIKR